MASADQTITLPNMVTLTASATDDGLPKPYLKAPSNPDRDSEPRRPRGVQIKWTQYRVPGKVTFDPAASPVLYGQPVELSIEGRFRRARHLCSARHRVRWASYTRPAM